MTTIRPKPLGYFLRHHLLVAILALVIFFAGLAATGYGLEPLFALLAFVAAALMLGGAIAHALLHTRHTSLTLQGMQLVYQCGIVNRRIVTVAVGQITDSALTQDLLDKMLGTASLRVNTSGSTEYEIAEGGFSFSEAQQMRDQVYALIDKPKA